MAWDKLFGRGASASAPESRTEDSHAGTSAESGATEAKRENRRSKRVYISMPVLIRCERGGQPYEEETITEAVNAQGCLLRLNVTIERGQIITVTNVKSTEEVECRVVFVGRSEAGKTQAGVEFTRSAEYFWHIAFPPDDWNTAERKRPIPDPVVARPQRRVS